MSDPEPSKTSDAEQEAVAKPTPVPDRPEEESENIAEQGEPLGGNVA